MAPKKKSSAKKTVKKKSSVKISGLKLKEVLDISVAEKFKYEVIEYLEKSSKNGVTLDAEKVSRITTPCVQVIISLEKSCKLSSIKFKILTPSDAFKKAFAELGLSKQLNDWSIANA